MNKRILISALLLGASAAAWAQATLTVDQLVSFVQSSVRLRHDDRKVADYIRKAIKLSNKLDARTVEDLQGMGAGPQTVQALRLLISTTAQLPPPPPPAPKPVVEGPPPPNSIQQAAILERITQNALSYSRNLPDFICMQVTRRYVDNTGLENYHLIDTIGERLSYTEQKEDYKVVLVNNKPVTSVQHEKLGGATSSGEFGSMLKEIFSRESETKFAWERWATLRGQRDYVFHFRVPQATSKYDIQHGPSGRTIIAGYSGLIYADQQTGMVMRIKMEADDLPVDFPIQNVTLDLNYDYASISGHEFLLPLKSELRSREGKYLVKNETEFRLYNKFGAESTIQFETEPDALPADKTTEQPLK